MKQIRLVLLGLGLLAILGLFQAPKNHTDLPTKSESVVKPTVVVVTNTTPISSQIPALPEGILSPSVVGNRVEVPILMYHHVGPLLNHNAVESDLTVSQEDFDSQVQYFEQKGYNTVSLAQVYSALVDKTSLPVKPVVFTFDDGFKDVFENAVPILEKYGYTGTFAIATELLGRPNYAVWDDVLAAQKQGMEIVSHSENHLDLTSPKYSDEDLNREIFGSKQVLEQKLGSPIDFFVYPYGKYNDKVLQIVKAAGYKLALTTAFGLHVSDQSLLTTPRLRVHGQSGLDKIRRVFEPWLFPKESVPPVIPPAD